MSIQFKEPDTVDHRKTKKKLGLPSTTPSAEEAAQIAQYGIQHLMYQCPVRTWDVKPMTVGHLFKSTDYFRIPIFQRRYCWKPIQISRWWRDVVSATGDNITGHRVGKVFFTRCDGNTGLLCIDGQQRITTSFLFLASLRDALLTTVPSRRDLNGNALALIQDIEARLYSVDDLDTLLSAINTIRNADGIISEGAVLDESRLTPSYQDRATFFELIAEGLLGKEETQALASNVSSATIDGEDSINTTDESLETSTSTIADVSPPLIRTKRMFDVYIREYIKTCSKRSSPEEVIAYLFSRSLNFFTVMYLECPSDTDLPQIFLWLQEKSLFGMGALLFNPSPGVRFSVSDMVRNLLFSFYVSSSRAEQEAFYNDLWIPLETAFSTAEEFDKFLCTATKQSWEQRMQQHQQVHASEPLYASQFEKQVLEFQAMFSHVQDDDCDDPPSSSPNASKPRGGKFAITWYSRFVSNFEWKCRQIESQSENGRDSGCNTQQAAVMDMLQELKDSIATTNMVQSD